jgi:2-dehydropantoate 2-reductase
MRIAVMGTGGLGSYIGGRLAHTGADVTFIARGQQLQAILQNGIQVQSKFGGFAVAPVRATSNPAEVGPVDLILFCVKSYDAEAAAIQIKPLMGSQTVILPVLNGLDHVETLGTVLGPEHVLGGVAQLTAHVVAPGFIEQIGAMHILEFGELTGAASERCVQIQQGLVATGIEVLVIPNVVEKMWWKLAAICGLAGVFSVVRGNAGVVAQTSAAPTERARQLSQHQPIAGHLRPRAAGVVAQSC